MAKVKTHKKSGGAGLEDENRRSVEEAAYYRWLDRGGGHGGHVEDWLESEQIVAQNVFDRDPEE